MQDPGRIETAPNVADMYLNASNSKQFVNTSDCEYLPCCLSGTSQSAASAELRTWPPPLPADTLQNAFFSHQLPWLKVIALNNYVRVPGFVWLLVPTGPKHTA